MNDILDDFNRQVSMTKPDSIALVGQHLDNSFSEDLNRKCVQELDDLDQTCVESTNKVLNLATTGNSVEQRGKIRQKQCHYRFNNYSIQNDCNCLLSGKQPDTSGLEGQLEERILFSVRLLSLPLPEMPPNSAYVRPKRPCLFCGIFQTKLSRRIKLKHNDLKEVTDAPNDPNMDRLASFVGFKKQGVFQEMKMQAYETESVYQQEYKSTKHFTKLVKRGNCYGFYQSRFLSKHKKMYLECEPSVNVPLSFLSSFDGDMSDDFLREVLYKLTEYDVGKYARDIISLSHWMKSRLKIDKQGEIRTSAIISMRRLGTLYRVFISQHQELGPLKTKEETVADMSSRRS